MIQFGPDRGQFIYKGDASLILTIKTLQYRKRYNLLYKIQHH